MLLLCMYMNGIKFQIVGEVWHTFFSLKYKGKKSRIQGKPYIPVLCNMSRFKTVLDKCSDMMTNQ